MITTIKSWGKVPTNFTDKNGETQTRWNTVAVKTTFLNADGSFKNEIVENYNGDATVHFFPMKKDEEETA